MNNEKLCFITGAGDFYGFDKYPRPEDLVIAADGGYEKLKLVNIKTDIIIGDFDSLNDAGFSDNKAEIFKLPKEKDDTDTFAAVKLGLERGCTEFHIYGGTGGRADHTYANIQCLAFLAEKQVRGYLYGKDSVITAVKNGSISIKNQDCGFVSVFAYSEEARGVSIKGLKYRLDNVTLSSNTPLGVSNEFIGETGIISVNNGTLLIFYPSIYR